MVDTQDTGEHILAAPAITPDFDAQISVRRAADLATQIDFLDREIARYRELVEHERIRHSTELANVNLAHDTNVDQLRRDERQQTQALHDSYRALLAERQVAFDHELSAAASASTAEFGTERRRFEEILESERSRREVIVEAGRKQAVDELNESHQRSSQSLVHDLAQAAGTIERLQRELHEQTNRASLAEKRSRAAQIDLVSVQHRLGGVERDLQAQVGEIESQLTTAIQRLAAERKRSAATLSELLERSASVAAEADQARSEFASEQAKSTHALAAARQRASDDVAALVTAADERASQALVREAELESLIEELRAHIQAKRA